MEITIEELREAYEHKLEIAVNALQFYADKKNITYDQHDQSFDSDQGATATRALEDMKEEAPTDEVTGIEYKFVRAIKTDSVYEVKDYEYGRKWEVRLTPKERGFLPTELPKKVKELREKYGKPATFSD